MEMMILPIVGFFIIGFLLYLNIIKLEKYAEKRYFGSWVLFVLLKIGELYGIGNVIYYQAVPDDALNGLFGYFVIIFFIVIEGFTLFIHFIWLSIKANQNQSG